MSVDQAFYNELYLDRLAIATEMNERRAAAVDQLGPADAYAQWVFKDREQREPMVRVYCCQRGNGWEPSADEAFPRAAYERTSSRFRDLGIFIFRWETALGQLIEYHPVPPDVLEQRRLKRLEKEAAEEDARYPLFRNLD